MGSLAGQKSKRYIISRIVTSKESGREVAAAALIAAVRSRVTILAGHLSGRCLPLYWFEADEYIEKDGAWRWQIISQQLCDFVRSGGGTRRE